MWLRIILAVLLACMAGGFAHASDSYSDNRSSAVDLVRSLYNAVNHHEYARAYDYFASPPAKDFAAFQAGYDHTTRVDVITGAVTGDGAAGSTYFTVPTAIKATDDKGGSKVFVGCYTVRAVNGAVQEPPFRPLQIYKGELIIFNNLCQKIHEQKIQEGLNEINIKEPASGLYHYTVTENKVQVHSGKIVIE